MGLNLPELFVLIAVPLILFPLFNLLNISGFIVFGIVIILYVVFRMAEKVSTFENGLLSFMMSKFVWPEHLSAYQLDEQKYIIDEEDLDESRQ